MFAGSAIEEPDLFGDAVRYEPYEIYRLLRREAPLYRSGRYGAWVVTRYADAIAVLSHPAVRHWSGGAPGNRFDRTIDRWMTMLDPRRQHRLRRLVGPIFSPRAISARRPDLARMAERLLEAARLSGGLDVVTDYAEPLAIAAMAHIIGVPEARAREFHAAVPSLTGGLLAAIEAGDDARGAGIGLIRELLAANRDPLPNTLLAALRDIEQEGELDDQGEGLAFLLLFLFAGHENMMNYIANAVLALIEAPDQLALWRRSPNLAASAVDELLRFASPVQFMLVRLDAAIALRDQFIPAGETILVGIGAANRDEDRFVEPDRLNLARADRGHLTFGLGPLTCIGAALARLEGEVALSALVRRMRRPAITGPLQLRRNPPVARGLVSLKVAFDA